MKIEMGESLFYSWLRHVKECQVVQTNWKVSSQWSLSNAEKLEQMMKLIDKHYTQKYGYDIFKKNSSLSQLLQQGECDVLGIFIQPEEIKYYAIDVAFHTGGLNYGKKGETIKKVLEKCARTAFCLNGYLGTNKAEIIFASPKIGESVLSIIEHCIDEMNTIFRENGFGYNFRIIANDEYNDSVLNPILLLSDGIADTSELFLRSYQLYEMFSGERNNKKQKSRMMVSKVPVDGVDYTNVDIYKELKIGQLAQKVLGRMLSDGYATDKEITDMQTLEYSKIKFDLQYPLLVEENSNFESVRYYAKPISISGKNYRMCSQWFEVPANNDRPYLLKWIESHLAKK